VVSNPALATMRAVRRLMQPGAIVKPDSVILELSNPQLPQEVLDAEFQLKAAEVDYENPKVQLDSGSESICHASLHEVGHLTGELRRRRPLYTPPSEILHRSQDSPGCVSFCASFSFPSVPRRACGCPSVQRADWSYGLSVLFGR